jgi:hypothetical protein
MQMNEPRWITTIDATSRPVRPNARLVLALGCSLATASACGDDDSDPDDGPGIDPGPGADEGADDGADDGDGSGGGEDGTGDPGSDGGEPPPPPPGPAARGIRATDILINQGVQSELVLDGTFVDPTERTAVLIGGRGGVIQALWEVEEGFSPREIEGRLTLYDGAGQPLSEHLDVKLISGPPGGIGSLEGAFSWIVEGEQFPGDVQLSVGFFEVDGDGVGADIGHRFPAEGSRPVEPNSSDLVWDLVFVLSADCSVPFEWTDELKAHLTMYAYNNFPVSDLNVTFLETPQAGVGCSVFDSWGLRELREREALGPSYFYQLVLHHDQSGAGCGGGGVTPVYDPLDIDAPRVSVAGSNGLGGIPFEFGTSPHELAHAFQVYHPWQDDEWPYPTDPSAGVLHEWGFGVHEGPILRPPDMGCGDNASHQFMEVKNLFVSPAEFYDSMAYHFPKWASAYTYNEIFAILEVINTWSRQGPEAEAAFQDYFENRTLRGTLQADGRWRWDITFGRRELDRAANERNYAELRGADTRGLPQRISVEPTYAHVDPPDGEGGRTEPSGVVVPLPCDYRARGISTLRVVVEGDVHEVPFDSVVDDLPRNIDWRAKLAEHLARRADARTSH